MQLIEKLTNIHMSSFFNDLPLILLRIVDGLTCTTFFNFLTAL